MLNFLEDDLLTLLYFGGSEVAQLPICMLIYNY